MPAHVSKNDHASLIGIAATGALWIRFRALSTWRIESIVSERPGATSEARPRTSTGRSRDFPELLVHATLVKGTVK
jgi:hypothetical protein